MRLGSYFKAFLKFMFLYIVWGKIKDMLWKKTKKEAERMVKDEAKDPIEPDWKK